MSQFLSQIYHDTLRDLDAQTLIEQWMESHPVAESCSILAVGKAAVPMALAARRICPGGEGFLITKHHHLDSEARRFLVGFELHEAGHPVPDSAGLKATETLLEWLGARSGELLVLLSGGASSLLVQPAPGLNLADLQELNRHLLASGLPIESMNVLRKHLSSVKGGQLGQLLEQRFERVHQLVLSDVCGPDIQGADRTERLLSLVGSGPTVADPSTREQAYELARVLNLPRRFCDALRETPGTLQLTAHILADYESLAQAARTQLGQRFLAGGLRSPVHGRVEELASEWAHLAVEARNSGANGVMVATGEPTVELPPEPGLGGRCQALALLFARAIQGCVGITLLCGSSDGTDGPTEYAGAMVDGQSWAAMAESMGEVELERAVERYDAMHALESVPGLLLKTGPTGQNLNDLFLLSVE